MLIVQDFQVIRIRFRKRKRLGDIIKVIMGNANCELVKDVLAQLHEVANLFPRYTLR